MRDTTKTATATARPLPDGWKRHGLGGFRHTSGMRIHRDRGHKRWDIIWYPDDMQFSLPPTEATDAVDAMDEALTKARAKVARVARVVGLAVVEVPNG